jgi:D-proline reductase (dithiol) PrdB
MEPIAYVTAINEHYRSLGYPPYRWTVNTAAPFAPLAKPLAACRVSLLTSGGISHKSRPPFNPEARDDLRLDPVDPDADPSEFEINDSYYDTRDAMRDLNVVFPIQRLRELARDGVIGSVAPRLWSGFMGRIYTRTRVLAEAAPALVRDLRRDGVDLFVLVPA